MANERDKVLFNEIERVYDLSAMMITSLADEIAPLEIKFGTASKIVSKKKEQLAQIRALYDKTLGYINFLRELNDQLYKDLLGCELMRHHAESGLPYANIASLAGLDPLEWEKLDKLDRALKYIKERTGDNSEFEAFIDSMKPVGDPIIARRGLNHISDIIHE